MISQLFIPGSYSFSKIEETGARDFRKRVIFMVIGIPRGFLYYKHEALWKGFFDELGVEYLISPETNQEILDRGSEYAIDESCLSSKVFLGHVHWLIGKCDKIFIPRISSYGPESAVCTKFSALYDLARNTFFEDDAEFIHYNVDYRSADVEAPGFVKLGKALKKSRSKSLRAYLIAKQGQKTRQMLEENQVRQALEKEGVKILVAGHSYNLHDRYLGKPVFDLLDQLGVIPVSAAKVHDKEIHNASKKIAKNIPWIFNRELTGAIAHYMEKIDGIVLVTAFPCGPDSLINELLLRRIGNKPVLQLILDGQEGTAGMETRLESFVDIIRFQKEGFYDTL